MNIIFCIHKPKPNEKLTVLGLTVFVLLLLPAPANLVDAKGELSTGRPHASTDHGALSYNLFLGYKSKNK